MTVAGQFLIHYRSCSGSQREGRGDFFLGGNILIFLLSVLMGLISHLRSVRYVARGNCLWLASMPLIILLVIAVRGPNNLRHGNRL